MKRALVLMLAFCVIGCGGLAGGVNASKTFDSTWKVKHRDLLGGAPIEAEMDLTVDGSRFYCHKKIFFTFKEDTSVIESDVVYNGEHLYEYNFRWGDEASDYVVQFTPDKDFLANELFWKIPKSLPTVEEGTEEIEGVNTTLLVSRQRSALGGDVIFRFWVDPTRKVLMQRADAVGEDSGGSKAAVLGSTFTCTELNLSPTVDQSKFGYKPEGEVDKVMVYKWLSSGPFGL